MRRFETLLALLAVVLASVSALQIRGRLFFALAAIALLGIVAVSRFRASMAARRAPPQRFDAYDRAERIHEARRKRLDR
jgi:hypothetical protein